MEDIGIKIITFITFIIQKSKKITINLSATWNRKLIATVLADL